MRKVRPGLLSSCRPVILPLVLLSLVACNPNTTRPRIVPFPEDASIEVHAKIPAATERLIRALTVDSIPIAAQSTRDGWVETPWLSAETFRSTDARPIGTDIVRIRGWVNPAKEGFSTIIVEAAYRPYADPSLPGRELERPVPKDHPAQVRLDSMGSMLQAPLPAGITVLGWLDSGQPVMGVVAHPKAKIFFLGDTNELEQVPQPLVDNLLRWGFE